jgi:1-acyl-sn-glycerol-3-phosphate acyltransferase
VKLRAVLRLLRVALHVCHGMLTVALVYPRCDESRKLALKQQWSMRLLELFDLTLRWVGDLPPAGLLVSNHISFLDVFAINAIAPSSFVAKDEVRSWPLIGWLAKYTDTLFLERGSRGAAQRAREDMVSHLRAGKRVAVFPEGTTSNGDGMLPFHSAMFQAAIDAAVNISPIAITYTDGHGARSYATAFVGEMSLLQCLWSIACAQNIIATITLLPAHAAHDGDRRHLSAHVHRAISHHLGHQSII